MPREISTATSKGQLVIRARLRRKYSIRKGTKVFFIEDEHRLILEPADSQFINRLRSSLKSKTSALDLLLKTRREERDR
jgi:bifunctional DNA-binding transcriptional regulator/antitoxin component of YhaV-PrlF toxin-antitoxin module